MRRGTLALDAMGQPVSPLHGDIYHTASGALGQARHVFLGGNDLPRRWAGRERFVILETGFGLGINFLATWAAWRDVAERCERLHFVSVERYPLSRDDLARGLAASLRGELADLAAALVHAWPVAMPGVHSRRFESDRVLLTIGFGDAAALLRNWRLSADALYLDGFSPERNPDMWDDRLAGALAAACAEGTTLATWSVAGAVRAALDRAGFDVERAPGFGAKRQMLRGRFAGDARRVRREPPADIGEARHRPEPGPARGRGLEIGARCAIVIGGGLAGCGAAYGLAREGWEVILLERTDAIAGETSAHPAILRPSLAREDTCATRAVRAGYLRAVDVLNALVGGGYSPGWHPVGAFELFEGLRDADALRAAIARQEIDAEFAAWREPTEGLPGRGVWYSGGGWVNGPEFCAAMLRASGVEARLGCEARAIVHESDRGMWRVVGASGHEVATAPVVVLANALAAPDLLAASGLSTHVPRLQALRGQLSIVPRDAEVAWPAYATCGDGYVVAVDAARVAVGATYDPDNTSSVPTLDGHRENLSRLARLVPDGAEFAKRVPMQRLSAFVGMRCVAPDRLPLIGPWYDVAASERAARGPGAIRLDRVARVPGLYAALGYASRGLAWSVLGGAMIAAHATGTPGVVEKDLEAALDPARFYVRMRRRGAGAVRVSPGEG